MGSISTSHTGTVRTWLTELHGYQQKCASRPSHPEEPPTDRLFGWHSVSGVWGCWIAESRDGPFAEWHSKDRRGYSWLWINHTDSTYKSRLAEFDVDWYHCHAVHVLSWQTYATYTNTFRRSCDKGLQVALYIYVTRKYGCVWSLLVVPGEYTFSKPSD